ncbi:MAG: peptide chain release factor N(5)-glutamine methyltransferase [candidate division WOR-3 bacterium]
MRVREAYNYLKSRLKNITSECEFEARWIIEELTGEKLEVLFLDPTKEISGEDEMDFVLNQRIVYRKPLQYIFRKAFFMGYEFYVDERVLIPRQDTEVIVEYVVKILKNQPNSTWVDVGTGSGAIAVSIFNEAGISGFATDLSKKVIDIAKKNAQRFNANIKFIVCDLLEAFKDLKFDLIVSNPPYVSADEYESLLPEVKSEPYEALVGGVEGYEVTERILKEARRVLKPGGHIIIETSQKVFENLKGRGVFNFFELKSEIFDLSGNLRGFHLCKRD